LIAPSSRGCSPSGKARSSDGWPWVGYRRRSGSVGPVIDGDLPMCCGGSLTVVPEMRGFAGERAQARPGRDRAHPRIFLSLPLVPYCPSCITELRCGRAEPWWKRATGKVSRAGWRDGEVLGASLLLRCAVTVKPSRKQPTLFTPSTYRFNTTSPTSGAGRAGGDAQGLATVPTVHANLVVFQRPPITWRGHSFTPRTGSLLQGAPASGSRGRCFSQEAVSPANTGARPWRNTLLSRAT
jgi:hypothetical protein